MRGPFFSFLVLVASLAAGPAFAAKPKPIPVAFVGPLAGPLAPWANEYLAGVKQSLSAWSGSPTLKDREIVVHELDDKDDPRHYKKLPAALKKVKPVVLIGAPSPRTVHHLVALARKRKLPLILLPPWEPQYTLDEKDVLVHLSEGAVEIAIQAAQYTMRPLKAKKVAALHDGSEPTKRLADAYLRNAPRLVHQGGAHAIPKDPAECRDLVKTLQKDLVETLFICSDTAHALPLCRAVASLGDKAPQVFFCDGMATPEVFHAAPPGAKFLEGVIPHYEDGLIVRL
ncbi:MAG: ABC transporter substrate-binding protein, partial [Planctomycetota bacterium]|nr:ABC transporter substrate-binding protein [Planctomycetota bacterium]